MSKHARTKRPELVKQLILDGASKICSEQGLSAVTIQAVAEMADVTKGGVLHHYASKQILVDAMMQYQLQKLDELLDTAIARDPEPFGRFTRAYILCTFEIPEETFSISLLTDPGLKQQWIVWFRERLERHKDTDSSPTLEIVRLAVDGFWLTKVTNTTEIVATDTQVLKERLQAMTYEKMSDINP